MAGVVPHRLHFGRGSKGIRDTLGSPFIIGREAHPDMAVVENGVVLAISLLDLIERLGDQEALDPVARHEGQRAFEEVEPPERREFVEHHQDATATARVLQIFGQPSTDLVQHEPDQRLGAGDVRRRYDEVEGRRLVRTDEIVDPPVAAPGHMGDDGIAVEAKEGHRRRQNTRAFVVGLVQKLPRGRGNDRMRASLSQVARRHHRFEGLLDRTARVGQETGNTGQGLVGFGVKHMQDRADQQ